MIINDQTPIEINLKIITPRKNLYFITNKLRPFSNYIHNSSDLTKENLRLISILGILCNKPVKITELFTHARKRGYPQSIKQFHSDVFKLHLMKKIQVEILDTEFPINYLIWTENNDSIDLTHDINDKKNNKKTIIVD